MKRLQLATLLFSLASIGNCELNPDTGGTGEAPDGASGSGGADAGAGGSSAGPSSGIPRDLPLASLTTGQASVLCDWANLRQGGYSRTVSCFQGPVSTNADTLSCVESTSTLGNRCQQLTVGNIEDCANATGADLCKLATSTQCTALTTCSE